MFEIQTMSWSDPACLAKAAGLLLDPAAHAVLCFPTETLYGLGCAAADAQAVERIYAVKGRGFDKPLPLIVADMAMAREWFRLSPAALELAEKHWPGPLTIIARLKKSLPHGASTQGKAAVRVSPHPVPTALSKAVNGPLTATSANKSGLPAATSALEAAHGLAPTEADGPAPDLIIDAGPAPGGPGSTIIDLSGAEPKLIRSGAIELKGIV